MSVADDLKQAYEDGFDEGFNLGRKAAPRWARCEEELPRKTRKFVVWVPVNNGPYPCWYEERTALWKAVEKKWYVDHNPKTWWVGEPTHWMPIEPPKEDA